MIFREEILKATKPVILTKAPSNLPSAPGVYQMFDSKNTVIYVGKAKNLKKRVTSYFLKNSKDIKTHALLQHVVRIETTLTSNENEALLLESNLIKQYRPRYNILFKDDKSYPYLVLSKHEFPRLFSYRGERNIPGEYFGPYPSGLAVRDTLHLLEKIFLLRTCSDTFFRHRSRPCLQYQIGRCSGPCVNLISKAEYQKNITLITALLRGRSRIVIDTLNKKMRAVSQALKYEEASFYRDQISNIQLLQEKQCVIKNSGNIDVIAIVESKGDVALHVLVVRSGAVIASKSYLPSFSQNFELPDILAAFLAQDYLSLLDANDSPEKILVNITPRDFDKKLKLIVGSKNSKYQAWLKLASDNAYEKLKSKQAMQAVLQLKFEALQKTLVLKNSLERIACFDVSHTAGSATVVGVVVFTPTGPAKNEYRIFNIENIEPGDDYAALRQAISRYLESVKILPELFLIDGGRGQLKTAEDAYQAWKKKPDVNQSPDITFLSIAKDSEHRTTAKARDIIYRSIAGKIVELSCDEVSLHFLQQIRDEAHRFALSSHTKRRGKSYKRSLLDDIPGIGKKRRMALLRAFHGLAGIESASVADLAKVPGISLPLAEKIHQTLS